MRRLDRMRALAALPRYSIVKEAEGEGFEPPVSFPTVVFKTTALVHSAIPPGTEASLSLRAKILPCRAPGVKVSLKALGQVLQPLGHVLHEALEIFLYIGFR